MTFADFIDWCVIVLLGLIIFLQAGCGGGSPVNGTVNAPTFTGIALSNTQKQEVTRQILETNAIAPRYGIADPKPPSYYVVEVRAARPDICEDPHSMAEYVSDLFYDQTPSDKDREVGKVLLCFSGRFVAPGKIIITAEAIPDRIARFESEHLAAYHGNQAFYNANKYHTADNPHPNMGE